MKKILTPIFFLLSFACFAQTGSINVSTLKSRVNDSTTVTTPAGYGVIYFNAQDSKWRIWNGSAWSDIGGGGGGGGTVTAVNGTTDRITSTGGATPTIDVSATFEALLSKRAERIDQNNASTTSAQLATTISDETGTGNLVYSVSPTLTGTPAAPTAADGTNTTQIATTAFVRSNALLKGTSLIYPEGFSNQAFQQNIGPGANDKPIEIMNIGYTGHGPTDDIHLGTTGLVRINGRLDLVRNVEYDFLNAKWLTPIQTASAHGSSILELGGESLILHASPAGVNFSDVPHEIFSASANGVDGVAGITTGYFSQTKAPLFAWYSSVAYNPEATNNSWNPSTPTNPMLWFGANEVKGTVGTHDFNEFIRLEGHAAGGSSAYGAINFAASNGSYDAPTAITTGKATGMIGGKAYDGTTYQKTAEIQFISRGTISSGNAAQSIKFLTGLSNTASLASRMEIGESGQIRLYNNYLRQEYTAISTIPLYSSAGYSPILTSATIWQMRALSSTTGGGLWENFSTTSNTASAFMLRAVMGGTAPTVAGGIFQVMKNDGANNFGAIAATEIGFHFRNNATTLIEILGSGNTGFGVTTPTANIHIKAGTATASTAPLKIAEGTNLTTPEDGAIEHTSDNLNFTAGSTRYTLAKTLTATAALNFDLTSVNSQDLTITVTGAADGDAVSVGVPNASATANVIYTWWVSGANTVTVRASRIDVASGADPASGTFRASVIKY